MSWMDLFYIWSDGKSVTELSKEYRMTKVQVFSTFIEHLNRFRDEIKEL